MSQLSDCCISGHLHDGKPKGAVSVIEGMKCYIAAPESGNKDKAILFISDVFGYHLPVQPTYFHANYRMLNCLQTNTPPMDSTSTSRISSTVISQLKWLILDDAIPESILSRLVPTKQQAEKKTVVEKAADAAASGAAIGPWIIKHREAVIMPLIQKFLRYIRSEHKKVGAVGFCWGARYAILLTYADADPYVDCAVANHPSFLSMPSEIEKIAKPVAIEVGDSDSIFGQKDIEQTREIFQKKKDCEIEVYEDQVHGFTIRGDLSIEKDKKAKEKAAQRVSPASSLLISVCFVSQQTHVVVN